MLMRNKSRTTRGKNKAVPKKKAADGEPKKRLKVDKDWFAGRMAAAGYKKFAPLAQDIGIRREMFTRSLSGERPFTVEDVIAIAKIFRTTTDEVFAHVGYDLPKRGVKIIGIVRDDGRVSTVTSKKGGVFEMTQPPEGAQAIVGEMSSAAMAGYNGATFVCVPMPPGLPAAAGQLCLVEIEGHVTPYLGKVIKGSSRGKAALEVFGSGEKIDLDQVNSLSPVAFVYFA